MTSRSVHLGFEVTGFAALSLRVEIPIRHMAVTGQTQESGKTTTLTALIARAQLPAIAFLTKRGEGSMEGRKMLPFFQERADWQFVQSILESTMKERMKFERAWIVRACQGAKILADVQRNITRLEGSARNALSKDVYMLLGEYLERVVPMIAKLPKGNSMWQEFGGGASSGLRVMDLVAYPQELQMLVVASTLEWLHKHANGVIAIIPEAWKFIPQGRNTPVKIVAENLAREGAALRNYLWIDSQDMAAVDKMLLRACAVWLIGVQREANEIKRALANMPAGLKKPKAEAVATLELGQFFACYGKEIRKTYVQPAWMDETAASQIASGRLSLHDVPYNVAHTIARLAPVVANQDSTREKAPALPATAGAQVAGSVPLGSADVLSPRSSSSVKTFAEEKTMQRISESDLKSLLADTGFSTAAIEKLFASRNGPQTELHPIADGQCGTECSAPSEQRLVQLVRDSIRRDPVLIRLSQEAPSIEVKVNRTVVSMDDSTIKGKIATLITKNFFSSARSFNDLKKTLIQRGLSSDTPNVRISAALSDFVQMGFFWRTESNDFELAPGAADRVTVA